jgi:hypothetical protein
MCPRSKAALTAFFRGGRVAAFLARAQQDGNMHWLWRVF